MTRSRKFFPPESPEPSADDPDDRFGPLPETPEVVGDPDPPLQLYGADGRVLSRIHRPFGLGRWAAR